MNCSDACWTTILNSGDGRELADWLSENPDRVPTSKITCDCGFVLAQCRRERAVGPFVAACKTRIAADADEKHFCPRD